MTLLRKHLQKSYEALEKSGIDNPIFDARLLVAHALGCDRMQLMMQTERVLTDEEIERIEALIERRAKREPVARILGTREFWGLPFALNEATLEPRPDSETVVEVALKLLRECYSPERGDPANTATSTNDKSQPPNHSGDWIPAFAGMTQKARPALKNPTLRLLDLGTGTGCLLLALLHEWPEATGLGVDIAPRAVKQAKENAERLGMTNRAAFRIGDWLKGIDGTFDVIVSNPPYIASQDILDLMPEVREYDPLAALDGGKDGLDVYRRLIPQLPHFLNSSGGAVFEVGQGQAEAVRLLFLDAGFKGVTVHKDLGGVERCVAGAKNAPSS